MRIYKNELDQTTKEIAESLLFNGNGFLGIRNIFDEDEYDDYSSNRHTYINGFYDLYSIKYPESYYGAAKTGEQMIPVIDGQTSRIKVDGNYLNMNTCNVISHERYLDITTGESVRKVIFEQASGLKTKVVTRKLASFTNKEQLITKYEFERINHNLPIELETHINLNPTCTVDADDPRVADLEGRIDVLKLSTTKQQILFKASKVMKKAYFSWDFSTNSQIIKKSANKLIVRTEITGDKLIKSLSYSLENFVSPMVDYDLLRKKQKAYLADFWQVAKVKIKATDEIEESINYGTYALLSSIGSNEISSVAAKGLSGIGYEGHVFWDAEMYVFPCIVKVNPELAKKMLMYRINMMDSALANRKLVGYDQGILYPWRTISGRECSAFFEAGMAQHHINLDICYALITYVKLTADYDILTAGGWEMLVQIAEMFASIVHQKNGKYHLDQVTGPDEYSALVDDNFYTNILLKTTLEAILNYQSQGFKLSRSNQRLFSDIAINMALPFDEKLGIYAQDRDFLTKGKWPSNEMKQPLLLNYHPLHIYRYQVCKQADVVLACQLLFNNLDEEIIRKTIAYYDEVTTHDSSLSFSSFACVYAKLRHQKAYEYFLKNARLDLDNLHHNTKDGIHTASMGGTYQTVVDGFAGMQIDDEAKTIKFTNNLPKEISYLEFNVCYLKRIYNVKLKGNKEPIVKEEKYEKGSII